MTTWRILTGDVRERLSEIPDGSVQCCVTSPPYWGLRDYKMAGQFGLERTPEAYVGALVAVLREVRRTLAAGGTLWLSLGDSYQNAKGQSGGVDPKQLARRHGLRPQDVTVPGLKPKDLVGIPWLVAFALRADGWYLRSDVIWSKPNPMPESITDRPTKAHEYLFLLAKSRRYYYDADAIKEPYAESTLREFADGYDGVATKDYDAAGVQNPSDVKRRIIEGARGKNAQSGDRRKVGFNERWDSREGGNETVDQENALATELLVAGGLSPQGRMDVQRPDAGGDRKLACAEELEYAGKHRTDDPNAAGRRMLASVKAARAAGGSHANPFTGTGRNRRSVWTIPTQPFPGAHFAVMPEALVEPCILAGSKPDDLILDPFAGTGTVGVVAIRHLRNFVGIELNPQYVELARKRIGSVAPLLAEEVA